MDTRYQDLIAAISLLADGIDYLDKESIKKLLIKWIKE